MPPPKLRYVLGRTNGHGKCSDTEKYHVNLYFGCVTASRRPNRETWIVEIQPENERLSKALFDALLR